jgi:hypothetical protein
VGPGPGQPRLRRAAAVALAVGLAWLWLAGAALAINKPVESGSVSDSTDLAGAIAVAVQGNIAWTAAYSSGELTAVDFSNPASPTVLGSTPTTTSLINATNVTIAGHHAYVTSKNRNGPKGSGSNDDGTGNSLTIVDISNPSAPAVIGSVTDSNRLFGAYGVAVQSGYAYVAAQGCVTGFPCPNPTVGNSFEVIDVSNPASPQIVASIANSALPVPYFGSDALDHATSVAVSGHYAYVTAAYDNRLTVIDISNPLSPQIVASIQDQARLAFDVDVAVQGNYAYVANQSTYLGLAVVDISNPANPQILGDANSSWLNGAYRVRVLGSFAYVSADYAEAAAVVDVSNPSAPRLAAGLYDPNHFYSTTGVAVDATGHTMLLTSPRLSTQSGTGYPPWPAATGTLSTLTLDPQPIAVPLVKSSEPPNPTTQTSASFSFSPDDMVEASSCQLDGGAFTPCQSYNSQQYSGLAPGSHTFVVEATDAAGNVASSSYTWTIDAAPVDTASPTISGTPAQGETLTAAPGTWTGYPAPTFAYQWQDCAADGTGCTPIPGATAPTYTLQGGDVGSTVAVTVRATNSQGSTAAGSAATAVVAAGQSAPQNTALPTVSGTAAAGQQLSATSGTWTGSPAPTFSYQWQDCAADGTGCSTISAASGPAYTVQRSDAGQAIVVIVTAASSAGSASAASAPTALVTAPPAASTSPGVSGAAVEAGTLSASPGGWSGYPAPSFSYQWLRCDPTGSGCVAIQGAGAQTYTPLAADVGSTLAVQVTAASTSGSAQASSPATAVVTSAPDPVTPVLDDFNRPDGAGPPSSSWTHMPVFSTSPTNDLYITQHEVTSPAGVSADYYNAQQFGPASEVYVTVATKPSGADDTVGLMLRYRNPGLASSSGYEAIFLNINGGLDQYRIMLRSNGEKGATLASGTGPELKAGDTLLFRAIGSSLELWRGSAGSWTRILTATDTTFASGGYLALEARNTVVRLDDFGGGALP